ncbi:MAG: hypoxanthine phosphoribosyltransferase [Bacteroidota bacterium]
MKVHDLEFELFISADQIQNRVEEIARELNETYKGKQPLILSILNGAYMFTADLTRKLDFHCEINFVRISSYKGLSSSGVVEIEDGNTIEVGGKDIIIVEDIVDTGRTMHAYLPYLKAKQPASLSLVTCLFKKEQLAFDIPIDHVGFEIPSDFVIGYGLDYDGLGRNFDDIYKLKAH